MIGTKIEKMIAINEDGSQSVSYDTDQYRTAADWCNANNAIIVEYDDRYEVIAVEEEMLTDEEQRALIKVRLTAVVQSWMDKTVQARNYDSILTACSYAGSADEKFNAEGTACKAWRDRVWRTCYAIEDEVLAGTRKVPTEEELITELPELEW